MHKLFIPLLCVIFLNSSPKNYADDYKSNRNVDTIRYPEEKHFKNMQQLTFGGDNAEAYFSADGKYLIFQKTNAKQGILCDQIWMGKIPENANEKFQPINKHRNRTDHLCIFLPGWKTYFICIYPFVFKRLSACS